MLFRIINVYCRVDHGAIIFQKGELWYCVVLVSVYKILIAVSFDTIIQLKSINKYRSTKLLFFITDR